ncbi:MAG: hypothetical protein HYT65_02785 [Candidatus Yanofskybacteria bacterium]|nr:hypothetical protein [Candidatus Yanofskybacteria bacterium]
MFKFFAKLAGLGNWPKPKAETGQERFNRTETEEKRLAEERRQANLRRMAEHDQKEDDDNTAEETGRFTNEGNPN